MLPLHVIRLEFSLVMDDNVVSWGNSALPNVLTDEVEVIPANTRGCEQIVVRIEKVTIEFVKTAQ